ncbi:hypothetical protein X975_10936, partial [Stegodyphus mimosarum]
MVLKLTCSKQRQNFLTFPQTSDGKHGLLIPWKMRAIARPVKFWSLFVHIISLI